MTPRASRLSPPSPPIPSHNGWARAPLAVVHTAAAVRHALVEEQPTTAWSQNLSGACGTATLVLCHLLRRQGFEPVPVTGMVFPFPSGATGMSHAWVMLDDILVDVTATQFAPLPPLPEVYIRHLATRSRLGLRLGASIDQDMTYETYSVGALARHDIGTWAMRVPEVRKRAETLRRRWTLAQLTTWKDPTDTIPPKQTASTLPTYLSDRRPSPNPPYPTR